MTSMTRSSQLDEHEDEYHGRSARKEYYDSPEYAAEKLERAWDEALYLDGLTDRKRARDELQSNTPRRGRAFR